LDRSNSTFKTPSFFPSAAKPKVLFDSASTVNRSKGEAASSSSLASGGSAVHHVLSLMRDDSRGSPSTVLSCGARGNTPAPIVSYNKKDSVLDTICNRENFLNFVTEAHDAG
jgi:hypothetical protein